ncbi:hypothetical protein F4553_007985 [Allocatelliglobosispora scoriae]|uniref:PrsW family intramembrane metalloprotease n=1 Tax=Allocatelliglobosispora scoriae TaxID=643052 RepID=A0A841C6Z0_9ACTN|nr:PrsW family glutamic-type intramembrane protease [Allocatelliglobosispora scoriae]MBB5874551.1 hypothetical protein [Allocatelliglobosispora scoriae]
MAVLMMIAACYGVWQLAILSSWTRTVRFGVLLLAVTVGLYGAGVLSVFAQLLYTRGVVALTDTPLPEVVRTASYTMDPFIEELAKIAPLALLVLLHKRIRAQWGLTDYVLVAAAIGSGFTLAEALLRFSNEAARMPDAQGGIVSGWTEMSGFSLTYFPGLSSILTSWLPAPVVNGDLFAGASDSATNPHLVLSALAGLGLGLLLRKGWKLRLAGAALIFYAWLDHASFNQRIAAPDDGGVIGLVAGPMKVIGTVGWLYPLLALAAASYLDFVAARTSKRALPDVQTQVSLLDFATKGLPWTPLIAWRFVLARRNLYFAHASGRDTADLHRVVREIRDRIDASNTAAAWSNVKPPLPNPFASGSGIRRYLPLLVPLVLLVPAFLYFVVGTIPLTAGVQKLMMSAFATPVILLFSLVGLAWLGWRLIGMLRQRRQLAAAPSAELIAKGELQLITAFGALATGVTSLIIGLTGSGLDQPLVSNIHILDALGRGVALSGLLLMLIALALVLFPPGGLALAGGGMMAGALSPAALAGLGAALGALGALLMHASSGGGSGGRGDDYWEDKYGDEANKYEDAPRNERMSDANKQELQESGWLKEKVPDTGTRREFMKWLEQGHKQGEAHVHLRPGSPEAEAALQEFLAETL